MLFLCLKRGDNLADGTIIIDTKIDNSGAKIGVKEFGKSLKRIEKSFDGISKSVLNADSNMGKSFSKQNEAIKKQEILLESLKGKYTAITSGASAEKKQSGLEKQLQNVRKEITKTEQEYNTLIQKLKSLEAVQSAGSPISQAQTKSDISKLDNSIMITGERLDELHRRASVIEKDLKSLKMNPENSEEAKKLKSEIELATQKLQRLKSEAKENFSEKPITNISKKVNESTNQIGKSIGRIGTRIRGLIMSAALFSVLYKAFNSLFTYMRTAALTNAQFSASLAQIKGNLLTAFQPIYEAVMPALNTLMQWLAKATAYIAAFVSAIFGKSVVASKQNAKALYNQAKAYGATGKAAKKAGKEAEKSTASFDELNIISENKSSDNSGGGSGGITPDFSYKNEIDASGIENAFSALYNALSPLKDVDLTNLNASLERLKKALDPLGITIFDGLIWGIENVFVPLSIFTIQDILPRFLDTLAIAVKGIGVIIKEKIEFFKQFVDQFLKPIAEYAAPGFLEFWDDFNTAFDDLVTAIENSTAFEDLRSILEKIYTLLAPIIGFLIRIGTWFASFVVSAAFIGLKKKFKDLEDVIGIVADVLNGDFSGAWEHFKDLMVNNKIDTAKKGLNLLKEKFGDLKETVKEFVSDWAEKIDTMVTDWKTKMKDWWDNEVSKMFSAETWDMLFKQIGESIAWAIVGTAGFVEKWKTNIGNWWNNNVEGWLTLDKWKGLFSNIKTAISEKWNDVVTWWDESLPDWWNNHVMKWFDKQTWLDLGTDIKNGFVEGFKGIINSVGGTINKLISGFQSLANGAISAVNKVIEGYNSVADKTFLPKISTISRIDLSGYKIPKLAQGSVVPPNREFLALLGDNKKETEIVSPLSTMKQALAEVMEELGGAGGNTVVLELDGREVGRVFLPLIRKEERRKGVQLGGAY